MDTSERGSANKEVKPDQPANRAEGHEPEESDQESNRAEHAAYAMKPHIEDAQMLERMSQAALDEAGHASGVVRSALLDKTDALERAEQSSQEVAKWAGDEAEAAFDEASSKPPPKET